MKIVIIGTGNVAFVLGRKLKKSGFIITQVFGRNAGNAAALADELECSSCNLWEEISTDGDIYLAAITDNALYELDQHLVLRNQLVLHTAGSVPMKALERVSTNFGVLYPLQSLRKELDVLTEIPLLVDGNNSTAKELAWSMAAKLSSNISTSNDEERLKLHVAAVFINNFTNHLYAVAECFCRQESVDFSMLLPLAMETAKRIAFQSPALLTTGPAFRNDEVTINRHLDLLIAYPRIQKLYRQMTESIQESNC